MSIVDQPTIGSDAIVSTSIGCLPLQALVFVLREDYDRAQLIAAYRRFDPLPTAVDYPGRAYLGVPPGQELGLPPGWMGSESGCCHPNGFSVHRDGDDVIVSWPDESITITRRWFEEQLDLVQVSRVVVIPIGYHEESQAHDHADPDDTIRAEFEKHGLEVTPITQLFGVPVGPGWISVTKPDDEQ
jgi:hypothetical protein